MSESPENDSKKESPPIKYELPPALTNEEINQNFEKLAKIVTDLANVIQINTKSTNDSVKKLATETSDNFNKISKDIKTMFSSQGIVWTICVIVLFLFILTLKGIIDLIRSFF